MKVCGSLPVMCELPTGFGKDAPTFDQMLDIGLLTIEEILAHAHTDGLRPYELWQKVKKTIYSRFMAFQLTERGQSMLATATRGGKRLLELVNDGYCVETIVRKAVVGSFSIWKALADLASAQAIIAVPDNELPMLAEEYDKEHKIEQAWVKNPFTVRTSERYAGTPIEAAAEVLEKHRLNKRES